MGVYLGLMSFFEGVEPPPRPKSQIVEPPEWSRPPSGILPAPSALQFTALMSDDFAMIVDQFLVYPNGVQFSVTVHSRERRDDLMYAVSGHNRGTEPPALPRYGLQFPDRTRWTSIRQTRPGRDQEVVGPVVIAGGGRGGRHSSGNLWSTALWIWPLPEPGTITFHAAWPEEGLDEQSFPIDADNLRALSADAKTFWPA